MCGETSIFPSIICRSHISHEWKTTSSVFHDNLRNQYMLANLRTGLWHCDFESPLICSLCYQKKKVTKILGYEIETFKLNKKGCELMI